MTPVNDEGARVFRTYMGTPPSGSYKSGGRLWDSEGQELVELTPDSMARLTVDDLAEPWVMAHRLGGAHIGPDNTLEAMDAVIQQGHNVCDGGDLRLGRDNSLLSMHDATIDAVTTSTGNAADHTAASWKLLTMDPSSWFGAAWPNTKPPTFDDIAQRVRNHPIVITPELKTTGSAAMGVLIDRIQDLGIEDSVIVASFNLQDCGQAADAGLKTLYLTTTAPAAATIVAEGVTYVGYDYTNTGTFTDVYLTSLVAAGLKPHAYTVNRRVDATAEYARGAVCLTSDDPLWVAGTSPVLTTDPFISKTFYHGHIPHLSSASRGVFLGTDRWGYQTSTDSFCLQGWGCPIAAAAGSYTLEVTVTYDQLVADTTRWAGVGFCCPTDGPFNDTTAVGSGYVAFVRINGEMRLFRRDNGVSTSIATAVATAAIVAGGTYRLRLTVTPTHVTVTRVDTGQSLAAIADATYRGGFFHFGKNGSGGALHCSFNDAAIA